MYIEDFYEKITFNNIHKLIWLDKQNYILFLENDIISYHIISYIEHFRNCCIKWQQMVLISE